ncbi:bis(5'-nucleosyl)-tetraphosphatase (symmetrical) YqeK [Ruminiclostridium josui]|uniref:bis(5'-nucleosyl)-tetraphosphatase (symmetrical) YqeK n=1 Tax=Ruminiclostridium josui TaxID=1499 RepID=UPI000A49E5CC|nr:bis(5'-nucleosyl)-tetraphosphatase (symmetrical) YqeK [Ruminiclostridium josui]
MKWICCLKKSLKPGRYIHSVNTMKVAVELAQHYGEDVEKAKVAGLLHDCAKNLEDNEIKQYCIENHIELTPIEEKQLFLMHGAVGAVLAREKYGVEDSDVLNAIKYHTTGFAEMSTMDKIIFLADYIEPGRNHSDVEEARNLAFIDLDRALISAFNSVIKYVISHNGLIHPFTIEARNSILLLKQKNE